MRPLTYNCQPFLATYEFFALRLQSIDIQPKALLLRVAFNQIGKL